MNTNLKVLLTVATVMALASSLAMAKSHGRVPQAAPANARASVMAPNAPAQRVYAPDLPVAPYTIHGLTPDFQLSRPF
jgi:hypothetical protein